MSCSNLCPCQFNWPIDTQGSKRDPVSSEKAWLDFAVRFLSREAVGKARGQESVWGAACKPSWWDSEVGLAWKNPTSNPKDTKDTLLQKYEALARHLRVEGRFPQELEEEARLWGEGKHKELYLLTSLTSLLGKVTGVHTAVLGAAAKSDELKAEINQSLLQDIKTCLGSTLSTIENLNCNKSRKTLKRPNSNKVTGKENEASPAKIPKPSNSKPCERLPAIRPRRNDNLKQPEQTSASPATAISEYSKKLLAKHKVVSNVGSQSKQISESPVPSLSPNVSSSFIGPVVSETETFPQPHIAAPSPQPHNATPSPPVYINLSQEQVDMLLQGQSIPLLKTGVEMNSTPHETNTPQSSFICGNVVNQSAQPPLTSDVNTATVSSHFLIDSSIVSKSTNTPSSQVDFGNNEFDPSFDFLKVQDKDLCTDLLVSPNQNNITSFISENIPSTPVAIPLLEDLLDEQSELMSESLTEAFTGAGQSSQSCNINNHFSNTLSGERENICRSEERIASTSSDSELSPRISDHGYGSDEGAIHFDDLNNSEEQSDEGAINFDDLFSSEEQSILWEEDGSSLLDHFLTDLEAS